jgi:hypothetical protein
MLPLRRIVANITVLQDYFLLVLDVLPLKFFSLCPELIHLRHMLLLLPVKLNLQVVGLTLLVNEALQASLALRNKAQKPPGENSLHFESF